MAATSQTPTTPTTIEMAVSAIVSANPDITPAEARKVIAAVAKMRETQQAADTFVELATGGLAAAAGSNACGGGSNACGGGKFA
jgi:hypothetical protein